MKITEIIALQDDLADCLRRLAIAEPGYQAALDTVAKMREEQKRLNEKIIELEAQICRTVDGQYVIEAGRYRDTIQTILKIAVCAWPVSRESSDDTKRLALAVFARMSNIRACCRAALKKPDCPVCHGSG